MTVFEIYAQAMALSDEDKQQLLHALIDASGRTTVEQPIAQKASKRKELEAPKEELIEIIRKPIKGKAVIRLGYGDGRKGAKELLKSCGFEWKDEYAEGRELGTYVGTNADYKKLPIKDYVFNEGTPKEHKGVALIISAEWVQNGRDMAKKKAERKAKA